MYVSAPTTRDMSLVAEKALVIVLQVVSACAGPLPSGAFTMTLNKPWYRSCGLVPRTAGCVNVGMNVGFTKRVPVVGLKATFSYAIGVVPTVDARCVSRAARILL